MFLTGNACSGLMATIDGAMTIVFGISIVMTIDDSVTIVISSCTEGNSAFGVSPSGGSP